MLWLTDEINKTIYNYLKHKTTCVTNFKLTILKPFLKTITFFYGVEHDTYEYYILGFVGNKNFVERARVIYNAGRYEEEGFYTSQVNMMCVFTEMLVVNGYKNNWHY